MDFYFNKIFIIKVTKTFMKIDVFIQDSFVNSS